MCVHSHPFWPGLGALLLKVRTVLCLNLGGAFFSAGVATSAILIRSLEEKVKDEKQKSTIYYIYPNLLLNNSIII